jgi:hypothetical protein
MGPGQYAWDRFWRALKIFVGSAALVDILLTIAVVCLSLSLGLGSRVLSLIQEVPLWLVLLPVIALAAVRLFMANYREYRETQEKLSSRPDQGVQPIQQQVIMQPGSTLNYYTTTGPPHQVGVAPGGAPGTEVPQHPNVEIEQGDPEQDDPTGEEADATEEDSSQGEGESSEEGAPSEDKGT